MWASKKDWRRASGPKNQPTSGSIRRFFGMIYFVKRRRRCSVIGTDVKQMRWLELFYIRALRAEMRNMLSEKPKPESDQRECQCHGCPFIL
jgi:hypothetical protein